MWVSWLALALKNSENEAELESQSDLITAVARAPIDDLEPVAEALCELLAEVRVTGNPADSEIRVINPHNAILLESRQCDTNGRVVISHFNVIKAVNTIIDCVDCGSARH